MKIDFDTTGYNTGFYIVHEEDSDDFPAAQRAIIIKAFDLPDSLAMIQIWTIVHDCIESGTPIPAKYQAACKFIYNWGFKAFASDDLEDGMKMCRPGFRAIEYN